MKKIVIIYGSLLALIIVGVKVAEYQFLKRDLTLEAYIAIIAIVCAGIGVWIGIKAIPGKKESTTHAFVRNTKELEQLGISNRELEVLELMASGFSNQEIGDRLFVSLSTVKTHVGNLFVKLDVKRRTQAVQRAKELNLIP